MTTEGLVCRVFTAHRSRKAPTLPPTYGRNIAGQQIPTLLDSTSCVRLPSRCMLLRVVVQSLKPVKHLATCKRTQHCWANHVGSCWPTMLRPSARGLIRIIPTICYNQANKVTSVKWVGCIICDFLFVLLLLNRRIISNFVGFRKSLSAASVSWSNGGSVAVVSSFSSTCISWVWNSVVEKE